MNLKLITATVACAFLLACGGGGSSTTDEGTASDKPATTSDTPPTPVPGGPVAPAPDSPVTPAPDAPADPPADAPPGDPSDASCSTSVSVVNDRAEYDESCTEDGLTTSRECTLEAGDSAWSCLCTAASGSRSSCQAPLSRPGFITDPDDCCPGS